MFAIPDYDRYIAHHAAAHPGAPLLSRREFAALAIERRYAGRGGQKRC